TGGAITPVVPLVCTGPVKYRGEEALGRDIDNLKAALRGTRHHAAFMPAVAPSGVGLNEYYRSEEEFLHAVGAALRTEYRAIADAGFLLQIDDPFLADSFADPAPDAKQRRARATMYVEAINLSLRGIAAEKVRFHTCYGINEGPRIHEAALSDVVGYMLKVNAGAYSFEAANPRHEHEYHLWEKVKLPKDKKLVPGVITHASNIVEHPELIAERLVRFAKPGRREPQVYGTMTLAEINQRLEALAREFKVELVIVQSNHEAALVDVLHEHMDKAAGAVINPAGLTQHGVSLHDAIKAMPFPVIE